MNKRVQIVRALAIMAVVAIHTPAPEPYVVFIRPFLNFAVAMFIFLSAYLTVSGRRAWGSADYGEMIKNRLKRILPPYAVWVVIASLPVLIASGSVLSFGKAAFYLSWGAPYYFFLVYIQLMLLTPWIVRLADSRYWSVGMAITPLALGVIYYFKLCGISLPGLSYAVPFPVWFGFYYLGVILAQRQIRVWGTRHFVLLWLVSIFLQVAEAWWWYLNGDVGMATTQIKLTSFLTSIAACLLAYRYIRGEQDEYIQNFAGRLFMLVSNCSMGIFLCHIPLLGAWHWVASYLHIPAPYPINTLVGIVGSLLIVLFVGRLFPKTIVDYLGFSCGKLKMNKGVKLLAK